MIVLAATSVMMGVELLKFIAVLFLELHFAYVQELSKRHLGKLIEQLSNCERKSTLKKKKQFCLPKFTHIFTIDHEDSACQTGQSLAHTAVFNYTNKGRKG